MIRLNQLPQRPIAVDLFCGVGGLGLGVEQSGFDVAAAFDSLEFNVTSHQLNFPHTKSIQSDLSTKSGDQLRVLGGFQDIDVDLVFGGPPCQGFSYGGKRDLNDERNKLVFDFARLVRQIRPKYFLMENVQGLMSEHSRPVLDSFVRRMKLAGYGVVEPILVLNSADFGVPQRRRRVIVLVYRNGLAAPSYPVVLTPQSGGSQRRVTVRDAISDLPSLEDFNELFECDTFPKSLPKPRRTYARILRGLELDELDNSWSRAMPKRITGFLRTKHASDIVRRFEKTLPGGVEAISRYIRLDWDSVAPTLRAGTGADHGRHTAPRPIHPEFPRCITTREAARLHSFPDWFRFHGTRWNDFRQIGNSVPPFMARVVAYEIIKLLQPESAE